MIAATAHADVYAGIHDEWLRNALPRVLPAGTRLTAAIADGARFLLGNGVSVIVSGQVELDGKRWLHVSCARASRLPSWEDLKLVKEIFIGRDKLALQVLPPAKKFVNVHPYCLHLFHCVDGDPTPDFTQGGDLL